MRKVLTIFLCLFGLSAMAITENEGITYVKNYYGLITQYATAESVSLATKIERMHCGKGFVYPDIEINLGRISEAKGVAIKSVYLASISSRQYMLLKFVPKDIALESNNNGLCTMAYTLYVYTGNEQPGRDVLKYTVPLKMEIQNSDKKIRSIFKGTKIKQLTTLSVDPASLSFGASGGKRSITVESNTNWSICVNTASWGHLTRNGNTLILNIDANETNAPRSDYFKIKAGDREEKITINQSGPSSQQPTAQIKSVSIAHNQNLDDGKGMIIYVSFSIKNLKDKDGSVVAYFYDNDGNRIKDSNGKYNTSASNVCTFKNIKPRFDNSRYDSLELKIPYSELHQTGTYTRTIKLSISIWDESVTPYKLICSSSSYTTFSYTPEVESFLKINGSTSDKTKYFSESGGRETYYVNTNANSYETWGVPSWCSIENKTSSSFTLVCSPNTTSEERKDWMKVKAGGKEIRIDIEQEGKAGPSARIVSITQEHNVGYGYGRGMNIKIKFETSGMKNKKVTATAWFYYGDNTTRLNDRYGGHLNVSKTDTAPYEETTFTMTLFIAYPDLCMMGSGSTVLSFDVVISDSSGTSLTRNNNNTFTYSQGW